SERFRRQSGRHPGDPPDLPEIDFGILKIRSPTTKAVTKIRSPTTKAVGSYGFTKVRTDGFSRRTTN
ncbi:MAG TPA: hypothetical protein PLR01_14170, partial [Bacteroidales bacterium]|nr:hypothetical protein [Bacteroidales bacterium]